VGTSLRGFNITFHWIYPILQTKLKNIKGYYTQGMGIRGPSGYYLMKDLEDRKGNINSYSFICFGNNVEQSEF
jgi:hypothetical protein